MAKGMWLEHPDGQEQAEELARELRSVLDNLPEGKERKAVRDAAAFLGAISDPDNPPLTTAELATGRPAHLKINS